VPVWVLRDPGVGGVVWYPDGDGDTCGDASGTVGTAASASGCGAPTTSNYRTCSTCGIANGA
jgi:hypothetical protein